MKSVYFIKPIGMDGPIKVGCSISPNGRMETLGLWCPLPLELIATVEGGHDLERRFHARYWLSHKGHEWFTPTATMLADIAAINAGLFDIDGLPDPRVLRKPRSGSIPPRNPEAAAIIESLGGTTRLARLLKAPPQTVQQWKHVGIPASRMDHINLALAEQAA